MKVIGSTTHLSGALVTLCAAVLLVWVTVACTSAAPSEPEMSDSTAEAMSTSEPTSATDSEGPAGSVEPSVSGLSGTVAPPGVMPEGSAVAYVDVDGLWFLDSDGARLLLPGMTEGMIAASPDGRWVAYPIRGEDWSDDRIAVVSTSTGETRDLAATNEHELPDDFDAVPEPRLRLLSRLDWGPDSSKLYFNTFVGPAPGSVEPKPPVFLDDLWSIDVETGEVVEVLAPGEAGQYEFSPDGAMIALTSSGGMDGADATLSVVDADGTGRRPLLSFPRVGDSDVSMYAKPYWSDDGQSISVTAFEEDMTMEGMASAEAVVHRVSLDGQVDTLRDIPAAGVRFAGPTYMLPLSPNGDSLAMVMQPAARRPSTGAEGGINVATPDADEPPRLVVGALDQTSDWGEAPAYEVATLIRLGDWSPDGERFAYSAKRASEYAPSGENAFYAGRVGDSPARIVDATILMRVHWLGSDHLVLLVREETPWLALAPVGGELQLLARLKLPAEDERPPYPISVVNP